LAQSGHLPAESLASVIAMWRGPERLARMPAWRDSAARMIDVQVFGETGILAAARGPGGRPSPTPFGVVFAPRGQKGTVVAAEIAQTPIGTVALRGPMVPRAAFPPGAERSGLPHFKIAGNGFVDTGYACQPDGMVVTAPPPGIVGIGGYRFVLEELQEIVSSVDSLGTLAALPDALAGARLAGDAPDRAAVRAALTRLGAPALVVGAFGERARAA
jgi:hypothetical protein